MLMKIINTFFLFFKKNIYFLLFIKAFYLLLKKYSQFIEKFIYMPYNTIF